MPRPTPDEFVLNDGTSRKVTSGVDYSAFFREQLTYTGEIVTRIAAFAADLGARATLVLDGAPFLGMSCHVAFDTLKKDEVARFEAEFHPDRSSAIPYL